MAVFVLAETEKGARDLCAGARSFGEDVALIAIGQQRVVHDVSDVIYLIDLPETALVESAAPTVIGLIGERAPKVVLVEPTRRMKVIAAKLAAAQGTSVMTGVTGFAENGASGMYFGGIAQQMMRSMASISIYTCTSSSFGDEVASGAGVIEKIDLTEDDGALVLRSRDVLPKSDVNLAAARRIVAAGRGFSSEEELSWARDLSAAIGGELGCTRPLAEAVDWMPREAYIGISGLMLDPDVYIGVGVSGQMQHMVGVSGAGIVFGINRDAHAPIFNQVDYGLIGDIKTVMPLINDLLRS